MWINHDDYIEAVEKNSGPLNRIAGFQETIAVQLRAIKEEQQRLVGFFTEGSEINSWLRAIVEGQDKLLQSHAAVKIDVDGLRDFMHTQVSHSQHSIEDSQDKYHAELVERLANIEVAFTVRLEALENRLKRWEQWELTIIDKPNELYRLSRPNGKHPAGKRK